MLILDLVLLALGALAGFTGARAVRARHRRRDELGGLRRLTPPRRAAEPPPPAAPISPATSPIPPTATATTASLVRQVPPGPSIALPSRPFTVGRRPDRDLRLDDDRVSREHATLLPVPGGWSIRDDGSSNGTRVNGHRIAAGAAVPLRDGDRLTFGGATLVFEQRAAPAAGNPDATRLLPGGPR